MRLFFYLFLFIFWIYYFVSIISRDTNFMGKFGTFLGDVTYRVFGVLGYVFALFLLYIWFVFFKRKLNVERARKILGWIIVFTGVWIFEGLFGSGLINTKIAKFFQYYIGSFGVGFFSALIMIFGVFVILGERGVDFLYSVFSDEGERGSVKEAVREMDFKTESFFYSIGNRLKNLFSKFKIDLELNRLSPSFEEESGCDDIESVKKKIKNTILKEEENFEDIGEKVKKPKIEIPKEEKKEEVKEEKKEEIKEEKKETKKVKQPKKEIKPSKIYEASSRFLSTIEFGKREKPDNWTFPSLNFLQKPLNKKIEINEDEIDAQIDALLNKLRHFKIEGDIVKYYVGPVVTTFEFKPLPHIKVSKILALQDDLAMALKAKSIRIQAPIPGKDVVGIEIPNRHIQTIYLREILESPIFQNSKSPLTLALGKDIVGKPFVADLAKLPHLLIAGTTGSGKSVGINAMIMSLLYRNSPDELKFIMIDPKRLEFSVYEDIPHLLAPVVTDTKKALNALERMIKEMERRYDLMAKARVRNIEAYNKKVDKSKRLAYIVIIIDELAELMMLEGKPVELAISRLSQMARASGIHLIVATQRPSVDVVTGLIKSNLPSRISFRVGQKIDSKVILDEQGAEKLLGRGDMLFKPSGTNIIRLHAPFVSEEEIYSVVEFLRNQRGVEYDEEFVSSLNEDVDYSLNEVDELFEKAKEIILKERKTSISYLQRRLQIGYNRAANIIEQMERAGILSPQNSKGQREILI